MTIESFFLSLAGGVTSGIMNKWSDASKCAVEALSAVGLELDCGENGWLLINRSIISAIIELIDENSELLVNQTINTKTLVDQLDLSLDQLDMVIDKDFFESPKDCIIVESMKKPFAQWLMGFGLSEAQAMAVSGRLPSYFVYALHEQWSIESHRYKCL